MYVFYIHNFVLFPEVFECFNFMNYLEPIITLFSSSIVTSKDGKILKKKH